MAFTTGVKPGFNAPVVVSNAARRVWGIPLTVVKSPPTYSVLPSAEATTARTWPLRAGANVGIKTPVLRLYASR